jgi:polyferredoxin
MENWIRFGLVGFVLFFLYILVSAFANGLALFSTKSFAAFFSSVLLFALFLGVAIPVSVLAGIFGFVIFAVLQLVLDFLLKWPFPKHAKRRHLRKRK